MFLFLSQVLRNLSSSIEYYVIIYLQARQALTCLNLHVILYLLHFTWGAFMEQNQNTSKQITQVHLPRWEELPNLDLYLDQVVTLIETIFQDYFISEDEKILTKTMINNYVKQGVITAPVKKKYNKTHVASLIVICIFKQIFSINDIAALIQLAINSADTGFVYNQFCVALEKAIAFVFEGTAFEDQFEMNPERYLLKNAVLSFAHKLYVERTYLSVHRVSDSSSSTSKPGKEIES